MNSILELLGHAVAAGASDLFVTAGKNPRFISPPLAPPP